VFGQLIEKVEENLRAHACETLADGGFHSPEQLVKAEEAEMNVMVNISKHIEPKDEGHELHKSRYRLDAEGYVVIYPHGKERRFECVKKSKKHNLRVYRCHHGKECPFAWVCTSDNRGRSI
jgi:hypothetical protein